MVPCPGACPRDTAVSDPAAADARPAAGASRSSPCLTPGTAAGARARDRDRRPRARAARRDHRRRGRPRRAHDADRGRRRPHRRDRRRPAGAAVLRGAVPAERERRDDRARVGARVRPPDLADRDHEHALGRRRPRRARHGGRPRRATSAGTCRSSPRPGTAGSTTSTACTSRAEHVFAALERAAGGPVAEGSVGGGTGMVATASRAGSAPPRATAETGPRVGVLVQANHGRRAASRSTASRSAASSARSGSRSRTTRARRRLDHRDRRDRRAAAAAPVRRLAQRAALGIARTGGAGETSSGDLVLAFATGNRGLGDDRADARVELLPNERCDPLFYAAIEATEEAIVNAMLAAETMTGRGGATRCTHSTPTCWSRSCAATDGSGRGPRRSRAPRSSG